MADSTDHYWDHVGDTFAANEFGFDLRDPEDAKHWVDITGEVQIILSGEPSDPQLQNPEVAAAVEELRSKGVSEDRIRALIYLDSDRLA